MALTNYDLVLTLKSMLSSELFSFGFSHKERLNAAKTVHSATESDIRKYYHWYSQKNFQKIAGRLCITKSRKIN